MEVAPKTESGVEVSSWDVYEQDLQRLISKPNFLEHVDQEQINKIADVVAGAFLKVSKQAVLKFWMTMEDRGIHLSNQVSGMIASAIIKRIIELQKEEIFVRKL